MTVFRVVSRTFQVVLVLEMVDDLMFGESLPADSAGEQILRAVSIQMLLLVWDLIEGEFTVAHRAEEGTLPGVNSKMIEEVVPFPEYFLAWVAIFITRENALPSSGLSIEELDLREVSGQGHMHAALEIGHVDILTLAQVNLGRLWLMILSSDILYNI